MKIPKIQKYTNTNKHITRKSERKRKSKKERESASGKLSKE